MHELTRKVVEYSDAVGKHGPGSQQTKVVRDKYADDPEFGGYADALDRLKARFSGKPCPEARIVADLHARVRELEAEVTARDARIETAAGNCVQKMAAVERGNGAFCHVNDAMESFLDEIGYVQLWQDYRYHLERTEY